MSFDIVGNTQRLDLKDPRVMRMCQHTKETRAWRIQGTWNVLGAT